MMNTNHTERRQFPNMRAHVDSMIASGAVILGRNPLKIIYRAKVHTLCGGMLLTEGLELWPLETEIVVVICDVPVLAETA
ncbi:MAG TPA: hypothetical protein ENI17_09175 [Pseudomonas xinjiangensis]|uniref:Uncharacterized protein n=2 Tax=root TaxID=1 RepID=A0A7V1BKV8_9GAMM|nr:hypothetical protein [Halopseudomonas xinjiangensis]HEC47786.1 hypothetical protein [Halopseudomonas xinjiangensis]